tara:strand:+ start:206 stop:655 length:450 start_codon:yes stop_codon:yes gene_type:complete
MTAYMQKARSINWGTPPDILARFPDYFDPCPHPRPSWDGLEIEWRAKNFVNPPFSQLKIWTLKCKEEYMKGREVVLLMPARVDTKYFHQNVKPFADIEFVSGRIRFIDLDNSSKEPVNAPFPSIICHYAKKVKLSGKAERMFGDIFNAD